MRRLLRENGLSIAMLALFGIFLLGQSIAGQHAYNQEQQDHSQPTVTYLRYLRSGHFIESVFENWESEFLQMGAYVVFTVFLHQKGAADSKPLEGDEPVDAEPDPSNVPKQAPWPVRRGGLILKLYENSLSLMLFALFAISFVLHALGGMAEYNHEQMAHGQPGVGLLKFVATSEFWFQSFQNWQSEFLSVGMLIILSIFLRQKGSPESKPVEAAHSTTGDP